MSKQRDQGGSNAPAVDQQECLRSLGPGYEQSEMYKTMKNVRDLCSCRTSSDCNKRPNLPCIAKHALDSPSKTGLSEPSVAVRLLRVLKRIQHLCVDELTSILVGIACQTKFLHQQLSEVKCVPAFLLDFY